MDMQENIKAYKDAAIADGWTICEQPNNNLIKLTKDEFIMFCLNSSIMIWGPDKLAIERPFKYCFEDMVNNLSKCNYCGKENVFTSRVGFAGRCCNECLPEKRKELEYPGWCD